MRRTLMKCWARSPSIATGSYPRSPSNTTAAKSCGQVCYWSRSRGRLWRKGETSGQAQKLVDLRIDCDGDTLLLLVDQVGVACHTGRRNCFFRAVREAKVSVIADVVVDPGKLYGG
jgi:phosphoribosyl-AMP cyclohydrolase